MNFTLDINSHKKFFQKKTKSGRKKSNDDHEISRKKYQNRRAQREYLKRKNDYLSSLEEIILKLRKENFDLKEVINILNKEKEEMENNFTKEIEDLKGNIQLKIKKEIIDDEIKNFQETDLIIKDEKIEDDNSQIYTNSDFSNLFYHNSLLNFNNNESYNFTSLWNDAMLNDMD
ncbi:7733_t:CDS:1, partial [Scutellospora calospora]